MSAKERFARYLVAADGANKRIARERGFETPEAWAEALGLNRISDKVLAYKPKPKSKPAKKRARRRKVIQCKSSI